MILESIVHNAKFIPVLTKEKISGKIIVTLPFFFSSIVEY